MRRLITIGCVLALLLLALPASAAPTLERIGPNADRPLAVGEVGWLVAAPSVSGAALACDGCTLTLLGCNALCTYRIVPERLAWRARIGEQSLSQGAMLYLPLLTLENGYDSTGQS